MTNSESTKLLVSVRDAAEAEIALAAGAALIDVKEPHRGSLGAADLEAIRAVAGCVASRVPVSVALGELLEHHAPGEEQIAMDLPSEVALAKVGLAGCADESNWRARWTECVSVLPQSVQPVAVIYADWRTAAAPSPEEVLDVAGGLDCAAVLVDTFEKSAGDLFAYWSTDQLRGVITAIHRVAPWAVVGGSLCGASISRAAACAPDYVAVRGAACRGGRTGSIDAERVRELVETLDRPATAIR